VHGVLQRFGDDGIVASTDGSETNARPNRHREAFITPEPSWLKLRIRTLAWSRLA